MPFPSCRPSRHIARGRDELVQVQVELLLGHQLADVPLPARMSCISAVISAMPMFACAVTSAICAGGASDGT